jgi:hypothetical protein
MKMIVAYNKAFCGPGDHGTFQPGMTTANLDWSISRTDDKLVTSWGNLPGISNRGLFGYLPPHRAIEIPENND